MDYNYEEILARLPGKTNNYAEGWRIFISNKPAFISLFVVIFLFAAAFLGPLFFPYETAVTQNIAERLRPPGKTHWFGTDNLGRDVFARIINGAGISLTMGFIPTIAGMFFGIFFGSCAAYFGKWIDNLIMRIVDILSCIPAVLLMLMLVAILGQGMTNLLIAITAASIPSYTREVRALILNIVENDYIEAGRACGSGRFQIIVRHVLPNAMGPLILTATSSISGMIMAGAGLSFLGLGVQPPAPEWGLMLAGSRTFLFNAPHLLFIPGLAILVSVISFNLLGDGLRDAFDPRLRR
jgi:ABC-type dipeptide/oligopeptide/nickel transport system permease subunit